MLIPPIPAEVQVQAHIQLAPAAMHPVPSAKIHPRMMQEILLRIPTATEAASEISMIQRITTKQQKVKISDKKSL